MADTPAISIRGLSKRFRLHRTRKISTVKDLFVRGRAGFFGGEELWAIRDLSLEVPRGRMVGIIGSNGSGKSTRLKLVGGILKPTAGTIRVEGRVSALIELGAGFHPEFTGRENVYVNGVLLGLSRAEIQDRFDEIVAFAGLDAFIDNPVKTYSSGMHARLGFAIAVTVDPDILLIDEVLAVGDEAFQHKCVGRIQEFKAQGKTILLVSHDLGSIERLSDEAVWVEDGRLMARGATVEIIDRYLTHVAREEAHALGAAHREAEARALTGTAQRWGSREVEITAVRITDRSGQPRYLYESGESCAIRLAFRARRPVEDPVFGIGIFRKDGLCCYGTNTAIDGLAFGKVAGPGEVTLTLNRLDLLEGEYLLDVAVHARDGQPYDYHSRLYTFAVRSRLKDIGVSRLAHEWQLDEGGGDGHEPRGG